IYLPFSSGLVLIVLVSGSVAGCNALEPAGVTNATADSLLLLFPEPTAITRKTLLYFTNYKYNYLFMCTFLSWWLQWMSTFKTPSCRENISRIITTPVIKSTAPTIKRNMYLILINCANGCKPSNLNLNRGPRTPTTVAIQVDVKFRGSNASNFILILNSFVGGISC
ncbi:hypothetical protein ALC53_13385, partial [Atta colombica]